MDSYREASYGDFRDDPQKHYFIQNCCSEAGTDCWLCGKPAISHADPAADGPEVEIIRREMEIAAGHSLHWTDSDGRVLSHPMSTTEASEKGISI